MDGDVDGDMDGDVVGEDIGELHPLSGIKERRVFGLWLYWRRVLTDNTQVVLTDGCYLCACTSVESPYNKYYYYITGYLLFRGSVTLL